LGKGGFGQVFFILTVISFSRFGWPPNLIGNLPWKLWKTAINLQKLRKNGLTIRGLTCLIFWMLFFWKITSPFLVRYHMCFRFFQNWIIHSDKIWFSLLLREHSFPQTLFIVMEYCSQGNLQSFNEGIKNGKNNELILKCGVDVLSFVKCFILLFNYMVIYK
jgi:hypothetical protein